MMNIEIINYTVAESADYRQKKSPRLSSTLRGKRTLHAIKNIASSPLSPETRTEVLTTVEKFLFSAEEQYSALCFFYKLQGVERVNPHNYRIVSDEEKTEIKELYNKGRSLAEIARLMDRHVSTIFYTVKGTNHKKIPSCLKHMKKRR